MSMHEPKREDGERICPNCGYEHATGVWQEKQDYLDGEEPDLIGCRKCGEMSEC